MSWIDELISNYYEFVRNRTFAIVDQSTDWAVISTPFLDMFNDGIEVYVKKNGDKYLLSDDGITLKNLESSGVNINRSNSRKLLVEKVLLNFGIGLKNGELVTEASIKSFPQQKLNLLSAILELNELSILSKPTISSIFREEVETYLKEKEIIFIPYFITKGSTGLEFNFDFLFAGHKEEIVAKVFSSINTTLLGSFLFSWEDIKVTRQRVSNKNLAGLAIVNDIERIVKPDYIEALNQKGTKIFQWSKKNEETTIQLLKAG